MFLSNRNHSNNRSYSQFERPTRRPFFLIQTPIVPAVLLSLMLIMSTTLKADQSAYSNGIDLGLGVGFSYGDEDDADITSVAIRGHRWFSDRWGAEASLSVNDADSVVNDMEHIDLSALYRLHQNERWSLFLFGGVGAARYDSGRIRILFDQSLEIEGESSPSLHFGLGFNVRMTDRLYFRPELRSHKYLDFNDAVDDRTFDASLGFGWRF